MHDVRPEKKPQIGAVVLDVDGVLIGGLAGVNSPAPHPQVMDYLRRMHQQGTVVCLCTVRPTFAVLNIIEIASLDNAHITDSGALITNPLRNRTLARQEIPPEITVDIVSRLVGTQVYTEIYTETDYFVQTNRVGRKTEVHTAILGRPPTVVDALGQECAGRAITKIMVIAKDAAAAARAELIVCEQQERIALFWGSHPQSLPWRFGIITARTVSKRKGLATALAFEQVAPANTLGIGDSSSDWQFMADCGYVGTLNNATTELKTKVNNKGNHGFIGRSIDDNGVIDVLKWYGL